MANRTFSIEGCGRKHYALGYCSPHWQRQHRLGDPLGTLGAEVKEHIRGRTCSFDGCGRPHDSHGYCAAHAGQLARGIELRPIRPSWKGAKCAAEPACHDPVISRGLCIKHYQRWRKHGDTSRVDQGREGSRKYALNETYFDDIATEAQAYWLGFIVADGCVIKSAKTFALRVELSVRDEDHLARLRADLSATRPLRHRTGPHGTGQVSASFDSWRLVESLERLGVTPRKSATAEPWNGPADLMRHYWRGMFDGDGSIFQTSRDGVWNLAMCGSEACVKAFAGWGAQLCGSRAVPVHHKGGCWRWNVGGGRKPQILAEALYADAAVALERKRQKAFVLLATDFAERKLAGEAKLAEAMRDAWASGKHPRARRP